MSTGQKLKAWLGDKGWTQVALVECMRKKDGTVPVDQSDVSKWINGHRAPNEAQKIVLQSITGIAASEWLPENLRKLAENPPSDEECGDE